MGSFIISNNLAKLWGSDAESLYCIAINNTYRMYPVCISNMCDILMEYIQMDPDALPDSESDLMDKESLSMYVLTNSVRTYGAIGMMCKEALRAFDAVSGDSLHTGAGEGIKQEKHHKKRGFFKKED